MTQTVYRIEHSLTGRGPYSHRGGDVSVLQNRLHVEHSNSKAHPGPWEDNLGFFLDSEEEEGEWIFGFASPEAAAIWFESFFEDLDRAGFYLAVYEVMYPTAVVHGSRQCIFLKNMSKLSHSKSCVSLAECV